MNAGLTCKTPCEVPPAKRVEGSGGRWIDVEPDDVAQLGGEVRVVGELELSQTVRLQPMGAPDPLHGADADPDLRSHAGAVQCVASPGGAARVRATTSLGDLLWQRRDARRPRLVAQQAVDPGQHESLLPAPDRSLGHPCLPHDLGRPVPLGRQQHDPGAPDVLLRTVAVGRDGGKPLTIRGSDIDDGSGAHAPNSHVAPSRENPKRICPSDFVH